MSKIYHLAVMILPLGGMPIKAGFILISAILAMLCQPSLAQTTVQEWIDQGSALYSQGKYNNSLQAFDRAIDLDPGNADAWYNKGVVLYDQGRLDDSLQAFNRSIEIDPLDADAWYNKGSVLKELGRTSAAKDAFAKASELDAFADSRELQSKNRDSSNPINSTANEIDADAPENWLSRGNALFNQGKYEDAVEAYDRSLDLDPLNAETWQNKGYALNKLGRNKEANECFWKATGLNAGYASDRKQWANDGQSEEMRLRGTTMNYALTRARSKISNDIVAINPSI
ncbi:MAG: tetratricopeptide repeat protein [Methanothrix sp.]|nr:tetratricopeptide repeat protein [Methanothrix sp.]